MCLYKVIISYSHVLLLAGRWYKPQWCVTEFYDDGELARMLLEVKHVGLLMGGREVPVALECGAVELLTGIHWGGCMTVYTCDSETRIEVIRL